MVTIPKIFKSRRAITPVLSNLLLTVVAVATMAIATTATYVITTNLRENISERVVAEDLWFTNSPQEIRIYLRNVGKVAIHITVVYINHTSRLDTAFTLQVGKHSWLKLSYSWVSGNLYYVDIITRRGTHTEGYFRAP
jgi:hypothetical protein